MALALRAAERSSLGFLKRSESCQSNEGRGGASRDQFASCDRFASCAQRSRQRSLFRQLNKRRVRRQASAKKQQVCWSSSRGPRMPLNLMNTLAGRAAIFAVDALSRALPGLSVDTALVKRGSATLVEALITSRSFPSPQLLYASRRPLTFEQ